MMLRRWLSVLLVFLLGSEGAGAMAAKPTLQVCQGSVCAKNGCKKVLSAAKARGFAATPVSTCLKGCGKGTNVKGPGLGKRLIRAGEEKAALDAIAKKLGI